MQENSREEKTLVNLPHDAMLYEGRSKKSKTGWSCAYFLPGKYTYTKILQPLKEWENHTIIMECEGVYQNSSVLVNGVLQAERPHGYTNYFINLSRVLKFGVENKITIVADNSKAPNSRWYSGSGVYREVQLYVGPEIAIEPEGIKVTTLDVEHIRVDVAICKLGDTVTEDVAVKVEILDGDCIVAAAENNHCEIFISNAKIWDEERPNLYKCRVTVLGADGATIDIAEETFGIRILSWGASGLLVNGKEVLLRGGCIHHDNGPLGATAFADAEKRKIRILKEEGYNAVRSAHNPISKAMLEACDQYGMYVIDELTDMWIIHKNPFDYGGITFLAWWKKDLVAMLSKDYNHPSVIMYSIGNEISDFGQVRGQMLIKEMSAFIKSVDNQRIVTAGINILLASMVSKKEKTIKKINDDGKKEGRNSIGMDTIPTSTFFNKVMVKMGNLQDMYMSSKHCDRLTNQISSLFDMPGYNYATNRYERESQQNLERAFFGSETYPKSLYQNWQMVKKLPNLAGDFMWTAWDYLGEVALGVYRYVDKRTRRTCDSGLMVVAGTGFIDICGNKRPEVAWSKAIWGLLDRPLIGVDPINHVNHKHTQPVWRDTDAVESWSWENCEGILTNIVVYSDAFQVELLLNDRSLGVQKVKACKAFFNKIAYQKGKLTAIAQNHSGQELSRNSLETAIGITKIRLSQEKTRLRDNGQDLCFVNIELVGENGIIRANADQEIVVNVKGVGMLQGIGSARPNTEYEFIGNRYMTFYGRALAIIRAGYETGTIEVQISAEGLESEKIFIEVIH